MLDEFVKVISEVGFPIAVASFVLIRLNGKMQKLTDAISSLERAIQRHITKDEVKAIIESYLKLDEWKNDNDKPC